MRSRRHSLKIRTRAFHIWQLLGYNPWRSEWKVVNDVPEGSIKGFYRGAFDSIPFLNDDAKRTFIHLLFRPGYMIRDYIKGMHDVYLAPLTSLIIFYAFFSLLSSIAHPDFRPTSSDSEVIEDSVSGTHIGLSYSDEDSVSVKERDKELSARTEKLLNHFHNVSILMQLDKHPEAIDSPKKASLAAFESALRSQGADYFVGIFLLLWPAIRLALRKRSIGWAAAATAAAYILCQFSIFMLFVLILSLGKKNEIGILLMGLLILIDYHQMLGIGYKQSFGLVVKTGLYYALIIGALILLLSVVLAFYVIS